jgi:hypothetical protein
MTKHTFLPTTNVEASHKEYLIASKFKQEFVRTKKLALQFHIMCYKMKLFSFIKKIIVD